MFIWWLELFQDSRSITDVKKSLVRLESDGGRRHNDKI